MKITITIGNSFSRIEGLDAKQFAALRKELSYDPDPNAKFYRGGFSHKKYLIDAKGNFPTGLLSRVRTIFKTAIVWDLRPRPSSQSRLVLSDVIPHRWQVAAVKAACKATSGGIVAPTGSGKSIAMALLIASLNVKTLVVVPSLEIKTQLAAELKRIVPNAKVDVYNIDSKALKTATDYDCLIIDEAHHSAAKTYQNLNKSAWKGIYHRFFFTATFYRNQENEQLLFEGICGAPIYQLTQADAIKHGYIVPVEAYYKEVPKTETDATSWAGVYSELVVNNAKRNQQIADMLINLKEEATLCLVKEIKHGQILSDMTMVPFANGQDEESRHFIQLFNEGRIKQLIATTGICSEGVDTKPAEYVIIAGLGKAKSAFIQAVGRVVRRYKSKESGKVLLFLDRSHKFTLTHYRAQAKILKEELGVIVQKLED